ncbi:hypothetical protein PoB_003577900 [Plakobranchus ocellatus]|uniref:Arrestin-like N-terminal domain-containing protein n=1 Tax=Plakobranchus ocellatus TaxID=259542 RepID=A0AAV4ANA4_9GAST|nr:hypothetical protein PoB_003577900 [Plakobranchus ocellatus]
MLCCFSVFAVDLHFHTHKTCKAYVQQLSPQAGIPLFQYMRSNFAVHAHAGGNEKKMAGKEKTPIPVAPAFYSQIVAGYLPCSTIRFTNDLLPILTNDSWPYAVGEATFRGRIYIKFSFPVEVYSLKLSTGLSGNRDSFLQADTSVWVFTDTHKKFSKIGHLSRGGQLETKLLSGLRHVYVLEILLGDVKPDQDIYLNRLELTMTCKQTTRMFLSGTATIEPTSVPDWYIPRPKLLPRREGDVLISY